MAGTTDHDHRRDYVASGTDLDRFMTPVSDCTDYRQISNFETAITDHFRDEPGVADKTLWQNPLRVLHAGWRAVD